MSEFASFDDAAAALSAASAIPEPTQASEPAPAVAPPATSPAAPVTPEGSTPEGTTAPESPDSFTDADLGSLLEGVTDPAARAAIEKAYKSFQSGYTRKSQEFAQRAAAFDGIDPERARQSVDFINALETDPNFVVAVHQQLSQALEQAGMSPAEAADAAAGAMADGSLDGGDGVDESDSALARELADLKGWRQQVEAREYENQLAGHLQRQEMAIRQVDPNITDKDVDRLYELAFAHGGDLAKAYESYQAWKSDVIGSYVDAKGAVPTALDTPGTTGHSEEPPTAPLTMRDATKQAKEYLDNVLANS